MKSIDNWYYKNKTRFMEQDILKLAHGQFESDNEWGIPVLKPCYIPSENLKKDRLIGFNHAKTSKVSANTGIHFWLHDYQFERVWNYPERYIEILKRYEFMTSPDFSPYADMPRVASMFNIYRNRWCGRYYQEQGIRVVPTITFGDEEIIDIALMGVPKGNTIAISTVGEGRWGEYKLLFKWWYYIIYKLEPKNVILYGKDLSSKLSGDIVFMG